MNPHSFLYVDTTDAAGTKQTWSCEMASRTVLTRNGLGVDSFKPGEPIKIDGVAARHNPTGCAFRVAYFRDGRVLKIPSYSRRTLDGRGRAGRPDLDSGHLGDEALRRLELPRPVD